MFKLADSIVEQGKLIELGTSPDFVDMILGYDNTSSGRSDLLPPSALIRTLKMTSGPDAEVQLRVPVPPDSTDWFQADENLTIAKNHLHCFLFNRFRHRLR